MQQVSVGESEEACDGCSRACALLACKGAQVKGLAASKYVAIDDTQETSDYTLRYHRSSFRNQKRLLESEVKRSRLQDNISDIANQRY